MSACIEISTRYRRRNRSGLGVRAAITGLTINPTHGPTAEIDVELIGTISGLQGGETVVHRWLLNGTPIGSADAAGYTPIAAQNEGLVTYSPLVDGQEISPSAGYTVRYAPPTLGTVVPVDEVQAAGGTIDVNVAAFFNGQDLTFSAETAPWASLAGSTLTIDRDNPLSTTIEVTASNSGGPLTIDYPVTISPLLVKLTTAIGPRNIQLNSGDVTIDLRTIFANATSYSVTGDNASIDGDGFTLRLDDAPAISNKTIVVTASNANNSVQNQFVLNVLAVLETALVIEYEVDASNPTFRLPFHAIGVYNGTADMGTGLGAQSFNSNTSSSFEVSPAPGVYTARIDGNAPALRFNNGIYAPMVRRVLNLGTIGLQSLQSAFRGCVNMTSFVAGNTNTSNVTNFFQMFELCRLMTTCDITGMSFAAAVTLSNAWAGCFDLTFLDTTAIWTSGAAPQRMDEMLFNCYDLASPVMSGANLQNLVAPGGMAQFVRKNPTNPSLTQADYDELLNQLGSQIASLPTGDIVIGLNESPYTTGGAVATIRRNLIETLGWEIEDAGNARPETPTAPSAVANGANALTVTLSADPFNNGRKITTRTLYYRPTSGGAWQSQAGFISGSDLGSLTEGTQYELEWTCTNPDGESLRSPPFTASTTGTATFTLNEVSGTLEGNVDSTTPDSTPVQIVINSVTYTQEWDGTPMTVGMLRTTGANFRRIAIDPGSTNEGDTITATPGWWLYIGDEPADDATFVSKLDGVLSGEDDLDYIVQAGDVGSAITFEETFNGQTVASVPVTITFGAAAPDAFVDGDVTTATGSGDQEADITIVSLPADNGDSITMVQYRLNETGAYTDIPGYAGTGTYTLTLPAAGVTYDIDFRAVNSINAGPAGFVESVTAGGTLDNTAPVLVPASCTPVGGASNIGAINQIVLAFDEAVQFSPTGTFTLRIVGGGAVETFDVALGDGDNGGAITVSGNTITLDLGSALVPNTDYAVHWSLGAIQDLSGNMIAANATDTLYTFNTNVAAGGIQLVNASFGDWTDATASQGDTTHSVNLGAAGAKKVYLFLTGSSNLPNVLSCDVGGESASFVGYEFAGGTNDISVFEIDTSLDGVQTVTISGYNSNHNEMRLYAIAVTGVASEAFWSAHAAGGNPSVLPVIPEGGAVLAVSSARNGTDPTWTGATKEPGATADIRSNEWVSLAMEFGLVASTGRTIQSTSSTNNTLAVLVLTPTP